MPRHANVHVHRHRYEQECVFWATRWLESHIKALSPQLVQCLMGLKSVSAVHPDLPMLPRKAKR